MGTTQLLILGGIALAAWYLWPALQQSLQPAAPTEPPAPRDDRQAPAEPPVTVVATPTPSPVSLGPATSPSACEAVKALVVMRDRLEAIQAPRGDINRLLEFAPQLLSKDGLRGNDSNASAVAAGDLRADRSSDPAVRPSSPAPTQSRAASRRA